MTVTAWIVAERAHAGQVDHQGKPYIDHCAAVVRNLKIRWPDSSPDEVDAAWLHDVLEDTPLTPDHLRRYRISEATIALVLELTRDRAVPYLDWIRGLARTGSTAAIRIKLADNQHNRDASRGPVNRETLEQRYIPAARILEAALMRRELVDG